MDVDSLQFTESDKVDMINYRDRFETNGVRGAQEFIQQKQDEWKILPLNIAVIGSSGAGKSTFINAIRNITADHEAGASVGCVETTMEPRAYSQPGNEMLKFWDLPGVGTEKFPQENYLELINFDRYDFFLILSCDRFTGLDLWLGNEIGQRKKGFYYVRTKIGVDVSNDRRSHPRTHDEDRLLQGIRANIHQHLEKNHSTAPVFLIDSHRQRRYDFAQLELNLISDFPALKQQALTLSLSTFSEEMVKEKVKVLRSQIWKTAAASAAVAALPLFGVSTAADVGLVMLESKLYFKTLGLDDESLEQTANSTSTEIKTLISMVHKLFPPSVFAVSGGTECLTLMASRFSSKYIVEFAHYVPFIGSAIASSVSFGVTYATLNGILDQMETLALEVMKVAIENATIQSERDDDE